MQTHRKQRGFTLIELLIAVAVLGIIAAIAIPSYIDYVQRSRRSQAMGGVLEMANLQQQFYADNFRFGATISNAVIDYVDDSDHYNFSIVSGGTTSFTVRATAVGTQLQDTDCRRFQLTNTGLKTATNSASGDSTATCWRD